MVPLCRGLEGGAGLSFQACGQGVLEIGFSHCGIPVQADGGRKLNLIG